MKRTYILYDDRATPNSPADASILVVCESDKEARSYKGDFGGMSCFSYLDDGSGDLKDERFEWNYFPRI